MPKLKVIANPHKNASILAASGDQPIYVGDDSEDLQCGSCGKVLARSMSLKTLTAITSAPAQLLFRCQCGAHNFISSGIAN